MFSPFIYDDATLPRHAKIRLRKSIIGYTVGMRVYQVILTNEKN